MMYVKKEDTPKPIVDAPRYSSLDTTHLNDESYAIRIPAFIKNGWDKLEKTTQVGSIRVEHYGKGIEPKMFITLTNNVQYEVPFEEFPSEFEIKMDPKTSVHQQYLFTVAPDAGYVKMAGKVIGSGRLTSDDVEKMTECRTYTERKQKEEKSEKRKKGKKIITGTEQITNAKNIVQKKREVKDKTMRKSDDQIRDELFSLFNSSKKEWTIQELEKAVGQSQANILSVLRKIATYDEKTKNYRLNENYL